MELRDAEGAAQTANTAELIKMIRKANEALDVSMRVANVDFFASHLELLRADMLELYRRLLLRNPYSSYRKDVASKLWFSTIYPSIEQYRANIKQFEAMLTMSSAARNANSSSSTSNGSGNAAGQGTAETDAFAVRKELAKWRARFQKFLQASTGSLLRVVTELAENNELVATGSLTKLSDFALDYRALSVHTFGFEFVDGLRSELDPTLTHSQRAALTIVSRLLLYLGDLSRYRILHTSRKQSITGMMRVVSSGQGQISAPSVNDLWWPAKNFYRGASRLAPHRGQPHNQLAVVHGYEKNTLDSVFNYYRALTALHGFLPAEANLHMIVDNALHAVESTADNSEGVQNGHTGHAGYIYYEHRVYEKFTHLRYLFASHQPTARERSELAQSGKIAERVAISDEQGQQLAADVGSACARFIQGIKSGSVTQRSALAAQGIHLFELQRLSALGADDTETALHSDVITRLSAQLTMCVAEGLCNAVGGSITDSLRNAGRVREVKSEIDLLSKASRRAIPPLIQSLLWLVSACVRIVRDSASREYLVAHGSPLSSLRNVLVETVRNSGLLTSAGLLKRAMEQVRSKVNRRSSVDVGTVSWQNVLESGSLAPLAQRLWAYDASANGIADGSLRLEEDLFVGWRLPDGTVWGSGADNQQHQKQISAQLAAYGADAGFRVRWMQLYCLLSLATECIPSVIEICDGSAVASAHVQRQGSVDAKTSAAGSRTNGRHKVGAAANDADNDVNDDDEEGEEETIFFHGRPPATVKQMPQPKDAKAEASSFSESTMLSIPPTPEMQRVPAFSRAQSDMPAAAPAQMMAKLGINAQSAQLHPPPFPHASSSLSSATGAPISKTNSRTGLVDSENDEVVSPAMIATSNQHRASARVAAIGSQRVPTLSNNAGGSTRGPSMLQLSAGLSSDGQWPFYTSEPSTAPVSPDALAGAVSAALYSPKHSAPVQYPGIHASGSVTTSLGDSGLGWGSLLQQPQQQQPPQQPLGAADGQSGQSALFAWQQYQIEHQKKLALQQQLDQQQRIQLQLQQQLLAQQNQNTLLSNYQLLAAAAAQQQQQQQQGQNQFPGALDPTTSSVLQMAAGTSAQANSREDKRPSLSSVYGAYTLPPRPPLVFASSSASSSSPMMAPAAPTSQPSSTAAAYSAYSWAMLPSVAQSISNNSMQYSGTLAQAFSLSSLSSSSNERRDGSSYLPLQFSSAAGVSTTTAAGANALPFVYGSYGST
ncbi:hypothetical protein LPJ53_003487 [Coemansia erecta]|uniref:Uncharacterized protein n=1 Tax=Coemansia erecta TaxID=147472 RepID=A0A9W7Y121_9FUNG|nr:hypothetical protein LPJ53_003487 [Coemansia erecta]